MSSVLSHIQNIWERTHLLTFLVPFSVTTTGRDILEDNITIAAFVQKFYMTVSVSWLI
jgi:hypothetical protein